MESTSEQQCAADMNDDGNVRANDAILILRKVAGLGAPNKELVKSETVKIMLDTVYGKIGESITVPLKVDNASILAGGDVCITYDSSVLQIAGVSSKSDVLMASNTSKPGLVRISFASADITCHTPAIAELKFTVIADNISPLEIKSAVLYRSDARAVDIKKVDGKFTSWATTPEKSALLQNFPNPFNPETWIPYQLKEASEIKIRIYTASGELVREILFGYKPAGIYIGRDRAAYWDGKNEAGEAVASGVYFYTIKAGNFIEAKKMTIVR